MAKSKIAQYNATIAAIKKSAGVSHKEAQQAYRGASVRMGRAPKASEVSKSRAVKEEARVAGARIAAKARAEERAREQRIERAKLSGAARRALKQGGTRPSPKGREGRREAPERGGGGPGGGPGGGGRGRDTVSFDDMEYGFDEYDPIEYDTEGDY